MRLRDKVLAALFRDSDRFHAEFIAVHPTIIFCCDRRGTVAAVNRAITAAANSESAGSADTKSNSGFGGYANAFAIARC